MNFIFPFPTDNFLHYAYKNDKHYLGNGAGEPAECSADIIGEIEKLIRDKPQTLFFIKPADAASNLELQIAFEGQTEAKIACKTIRLLRASLDGQQRNA